MGFAHEAAGVPAGMLIGFILSLIGGGGSVVAVPLLVYGVGVASPHVAIGTSAVAVAGSALVNLVTHARSGMVKWPCASVFTLAGVLGALVGAHFSKEMNGARLLALFGALMIVIAATMLRRRDDAGDPHVRLTRETSFQLTPALVGLGAGVGLLSGFFGIGGGFLIVPGLIFATGMPFLHAVSTSLVAVTGFGVSTSLSYAMSGLVDWPLALFFLFGGFVGGRIGAIARHRLAHKRALLPSIFAVIVMGVGAYVIMRSVTG